MILAALDIHNLRELCQMYHQSLKYKLQYLKQKSGFIFNDFVIITPHDIYIYIVLQSMKDS